MSDFQFLPKFGLEKEYVASIYPNQPYIATDTDKIMLPTKSYDLGQLSILSQKINDLQAPVFIYDATGDNADANIDTYFNLDDNKIVKFKYEDGSTMPGLHFFDSTLGDQGKICTIDFNDLSFTTHVIQDSGDFAPDSYKSLAAVAGLEELLAYGVEWKDNVADPHLTRIGNMSLHKTLPIQSQLKGCIAQKDKIIYWLNENDWRFRKDPIYMTVDLSNDVEFPNFGGASIADLGVGQFVKAGTHIGKIAFIEGTSVTVEWEEDLGNISAELTTITKLEIGSRLDGYDGTVRVYCPAFYIKSQIIGNTRRVWLSTIRIDNTWTHQPEILIDAYRSTVLNAVPTNMGYLSTLSVNSAISVVNTNTYCRGGGNRSDNDKYLTGADNTTIDVFRTDLGKPRTNISRATMRADSRNAGSEMLSYNQYKNIFYWLYVVEYANFNSQEAYNEELTEDGYHQGGMGPGVTIMNNNHWKWHNGNYPLTPCGYCNEFGNGTGVKDMVITAPSASDGSTTQTYTFQVPRWRGFDNPFGDIITNLDGIVIERTADLSNVWTTNDISEYTDMIGNKTLAGKEYLVEGYIKLFDLGETAEIIPMVKGAGPTQYKCDYHSRDNSTSGLRVLLVGGASASGTPAGLGNFNSSLSSNIFLAIIGFRTVSRITS